MEHSIFKTWITRSVERVIVGTAIFKCTVAYKGHLDTFHFHLIIYDLSYSRFSHDVTKIQTKKLSILLSF